MSLYDLKFSVYDDALENLGNDFDLELLNPAPFKISSNLEDENSNEIKTSSSPAILLSQNAKNLPVASDSNGAKTGNSLRTLQIKLSTLMNHVSNVLKSIERQKSTYK